MTIFYIACAALVVLGVVAMFKTSRES